MNLEQILKKSPDIAGFGGGKWAIYSIGCTWWTSFPDDLGNTADVSPIVEAEIEIVEQPGKTIKIPPPQFPCCPHCGSLLMQAPLFDFIKQSRQNESHFGEAGILNFTTAHSRNASTCYQEWGEYDKKGL